MANKTLTARVRFDTKSAEASLTRLSKKINNINNSLNKRVGNNKLEKQISKARIQQEKLTQAIYRTKRAELQVTEQKYRTARAAAQLAKSNEEANKSANKMLSTVKKIAGVYFGIETAKTVMDTSDTLTHAKNRFNSLNGNDKQLTGETMDKIYSASQRSRSSYTDMLSNVSKTMTLAGDSFQGNIDNAIRFQEIMAKAYTVGGASDVEASTSMYQLVQALGSGLLQGDELRSVREGAPLAYKAIEKFAQGVYDTDESLKQLAADGKITSEMVVAAIMDADFSGKLEEQFNDTQATFEQTFTKIKNIVTKAFEPALEKINELFNNGHATKVIEGLGFAINILGNALYWVVSLISWVVDCFASFFEWCANNWSWLSKVILTILMIIGVVMAVVLFPKFIAWISYLGFVIKYFVVLGAQAVLAGIKAAIAWMAANWVLLLIIVVIIAVLAALIWLSDGFSDACGIIVGVIMAAISVVWNLFVMLVTLIIKSAILPLLTAWDNFANFFGNLFNDPIGAIIKGFGKMADIVLSILQTIAKGIDAIFGSSLADKVQGWRDGLSKKTDELANKWGNGTYEEKSNLSGQFDEMLNNVQGKISWETSDAYNTGYTWGHAGGEWLGNLAGEIGSMLTNPALPDANDPAYSLEGAWDQPSVDELLGGVGDIKDSMDIADDDLEWMRRIAEMEWRNEFTTAEIKVDMTNNNTVNSDRDLDGIVEYLSDVLRSEMTSVAYGVHY